MSKGKATMPYPDPLDLNKNNCRRFAIIIGLIPALLLNFVACVKSSRETQPSPATIIKDLRIAITAYEVDSNRFPILKPDSPGLDVSVRSRGLMLPILSGQKDAVLNPKTIKFIDLPQAKGRKDGLWQEGTEWVLSDSWGESYYIVFDTSKDGKITNPEFGADQTDPTYAEKRKLNPPPATIPSSVLIYSSGKDRDPKTWNDNICSWRQ
jgi:hypothetical protein